MSSQLLVDALSAIAEAFDCPTRDRFGRIDQRTNKEPLRLLMLAYDAENGMRDTMDQAVFVARKAIEAFEHWKRKDEIPEQDEPHQSVFVELPIVEKAGL